MEPRLTRSVEIPERRGRPLAAAIAIGVLIACGAHNYLMTFRAHQALRTVEIAFATSPDGADVVRDRDGATLCRTPCRVAQEVGSAPVARFHLVLDGHEDRRVVVPLSGGDARVEAVLLPVDGHE